MNPEDYGIDMFFQLDFKRNCAPATGKELVLGDLIGRLVDELWYDPSYGCRLPQRLLRSSTTLYPVIAAEVERELERDDRVESVSCTISPPDALNVVRVYINGTLVRGDSFSMIGSINSFDLHSFTITGA